MNLYFNVENEETLLTMPDFRLIQALHKQIMTRLLKNFSLWPSFLLPWKKSQPPTQHETSFALVLSLEKLVQSFFFWIVQPSRAFESTLLCCNCACVRALTFCVFWMRFHVQKLREAAVFEKGFYVVREEMADEIINLVFRGRRIWQILAEISNDMQLEWFDAGLAH